MLIGSTCSVFFKKFRTLCFLVLPFLLSSTALMGLVYSALTLSDTFVSITAMLLVSRPIASPILSCFLQYFLVRLYFTINRWNIVYCRTLTLYHDKVKIEINYALQEKLDSCNIILNFGGLPGLFGQERICYDSRKNETLCKK